MSVLFVSHDASRTGAPIVLLHLLRQLKKEQSCSFSILLINGGELEEEFRSIANTYIWALSPSFTRWKYYSLRLLGETDAKRQLQHQQEIISVLKNQSIEVVYGNTVVTSALITLLKKEFGCPAVCHVHELEIAIERYFGTNKFGAQLPDIDLVIAASDAVRENIVNTYNFPVERIAKVYEFVPTAELVKEQVNPADIRRSLDIPADSFIVAASGTLDWRKSPDIFIQVANQVHLLTKKKPYFLWVGGSTSSMQWLELQYDLQRLGIAEYVKCSGSRPNPLDYLRICDIFILTSREDPYPLVCLEAASIGKPIICFAQSGGMPEFVEQDCGMVVPFLRTDLMAQAINYLLENHNVRSKMGANALHKVRNRHNVKLAASQIMNQLTLLLKNDN
jgi:glycosyltransferase involved in cell wall biosynthesis